MWKSRAYINLVLGYVLTIALWPLAIYNNKTRIKCKIKRKYISLFL